MKGILIKTKIGYHLKITNQNISLLNEAFYPYQIKKIKLSKKNCDEIFMEMNHFNNFNKKEVDVRVVFRKNSSTLPKFDCRGCLILEKI